MTTVIIIAIIVAVLYFVAKAAIGGASNNNESQGNTASQSAPIQEQAPKEVSFPPTEPGYGYSEIVGMRNLGVTPSDSGIYEGYAIAETNNSYDKFAVGIHRGKDGKLIGYVPRDFRGESNEGTHRAISAIGGKAKAIIKLSGNYGSVYIKTN